jgi:hypothetical protein
MFKNLFGKKNDGFYMQADEAVAKDQATKTPDTPVVAKATEPKVTESAESAATEPAADTAPQAPKTSIKDQKKDNAAQEAPQAKKTSIKDKKDKKKDQEPAPTPVVAAVVEAAITNFATDYLIKPSSNSNRRKPGANMKQFMDMARQVETKKSPGQRAK